MKWDKTSEEAQWGERAGSGPRGSPLCELCSFFSSSAPPPGRQGGSSGREASQSVRTPAWPGLIWGRGRRVLTIPWKPVLRQNHPGDLAAPALPLPWSQARDQVAQACSSTTCCTQGCPSPLAPTSEIWGLLSHGHGLPPTGGFLGSPVAVLGVPGPHGAEQGRRTGFLSLWDQTVLHNPGRRDSCPKTPRDRSDRRPKFECRFR